MPIEEFVYAVRDFRRDDFNELLEKIRYLVSNRDIDGMKKLLISQMEKKDKKEPFASFNTILIKIRLQDLSGETYVTDQEIVTISDYLFCVIVWIFIEIFQIIDVYWQLCCSMLISPVLNAMNGWTLFILKNS